MWKNHLFLKKRIKTTWIRLANIDLDSRAEKLGGRVERDEMILSLFRATLQDIKPGIIDPSSKQPLMGISVVLCKYLLLCPDIPSLDKEWVSYRDFKDTAPLVRSFVNHTERPIARNFSNRLDELTAACEKLGGRDPDLDLDLSTHYETLSVAESSGAFAF